MRMAEAALGPSSFGLGVCVGMARNPIDGVIGLLELQKTFVLADLYDKMSEPLSWKTVLETLAGPGTAVKLGAAALVTVGALDMQDLRRAHEQREALTNQLGEVLAHPLEYLGELPAQLRDEYVGKWNRFKELSQKGDLASQYEAGKILGDVLMEVATTVAGLVSGVGAAARLATKAPQLLKLGRALGKLDGPGPDLGAAGKNKLPAALDRADDTRGAKLPDAQARAIADRNKINELALAGRTAEARALLRPHLEAARTAGTPLQKQAAMDELVSRLDLSSGKEKVFWSGNREAAGRLAEQSGRSVLESTPGGKVIDGWSELDQVFAWDGGVPPRGPDFWGKVSAKYASDVKGRVELIQSGDRFPGGGTTFREHEWPQIRLRAQRGEVTDLVIHRIDDKGKVVETRRLDPLSPETDALFGGKR
jgi:hypothetical protein